MAILVKKISGRNYAYLAYRSGAKVVHKYLGPASNRQVARKALELSAEKRIPDNISTLFWDTDSSAINLRKDSRYVIERVLEMGGISAVQWIQRIYPTRRIMEICETSRKISQKSKNFWMIWFGYSYAY